MYAEVKYDDVEPFGSAIVLFGFWAFWSPHVVILAHPLRDPRSPVGANVEVLLANSASIAINIEY